MTVVAVVDRIASVLIAVYKELILIEEVEDRFPSLPPVEVKLQTTETGMSECREVVVGLGLVRALAVSSDENLGDISDRHVS